MKKILLILLAIPLLSGCLEKKDFLHILSHNFNWIMTVAPTAYDHELQNSETFTVFTQNRYLPKEHRIKDAFGGYYQGCVSLMIMFDKSHKNRDMGAITQYTSVLPLPNNCVDMVDSWHESEYPDMFEVLNKDKYP